jgi:hypothetical protein
MKLSESLQSLGVVAYYPSIAKLIGVKECVLVCQFVWWTGKQADPDGWIYKTQKEINDETGLARWEQETARKSLRKLGILEEKENRLEHKMFYRINIDELNALWSAAQISRLPEGGNPDHPKEGIQSPGSRESSLPEGGNPDHPKEGIQSPGSRESSLPEGGNPDHPKEGIQSPGSRESSIRHIVQKITTGEYVQKSTTGEYVQKSTTGEYVQESCGAPPPPVNGPEWEAILKWLADTRSNGSDFTEAEARNAFTSLAAVGWKWGKNNIVDWRSAVERRIYSDRESRVGRGVKPSPKDHRAEKAAKEYPEDIKIPIINPATWKMSGGKTISR